jgi:hypothetical protein
VSVKPGHPLNNTPAHGVAPPRSRIIPATIVIICVLFKKFSAGDFFSSPEKPVILPESYDAGLSYNPEDQVIF